jgi:hypothetical protein
VRLGALHWCIVGAVVAVALAAGPIAWHDQAAPPTGADYRIPYDLSEDYWLYSQLADQRARDADVLVVGDSVIWGQYVAPDGTLSHYLSARTGRRFANMGLNGTHPLALEGLIDHHAGGIRDKRVVLHCNPLWLASPQRDLSEAGDASLNHPRLMPQFVPWVPGYDAKLDDRLKVVVHRALPWEGLAGHVRLTCYDGKDLPSWTVDNPSANPLARLGEARPAPDDGPRRKGVSWAAAGMSKADFPWVDPDKSLQWRAFRNTLALLRARGNDVFVCLGPLNEHMLTDASGARYAEVRREMARRLAESGAAWCAPEVLPTGLYADASHPLTGGYDLLAEAMLADNSFRAFIGDGW